MNRNAIWETCGAKLISVCINRKLFDVITSTVYCCTICLARFRSESSGHKDLVAIWVWIKREFGELKMSIDSFQNFSYVKETGKLPEMLVFPY